MFRLSADVGGLITAFACECGGALCVRYHVLLCVRYTNTSCAICMLHTNVDFDEGYVAWIPYGHEIRVLSLSDNSESICQPCWSPALLLELPKTLVTQIIEANREHMLSFGGRKAVTIADLFMEAIGNLCKKGGK